MISLLISSPRVCPLIVFSFSVPKSCALRCLRFWGDDRRIKEIEETEPIGQFLKKQILTASFQSIVISVLKTAPFLINTNGDVFYNEDSLLLSELQQDDVVQQDCVSSLIFQSFLNFVQSLRYFFSNQIFLLSILLFKRLFLFGLDFFCSKYLYFPKFKQRQNQRTTK